MDKVEPNFYIPYNGVMILRIKQGYIRGPQLIYIFIEFLNLIIVPRVPFQELVRPSLSIFCLGCFGCLGRKYKRGGNLLFIK